MDELYTDLFAVKPVQMTKDGSKVRFIFKTGQGEMRVQFAKEDVKDFAVLLRQIWLAADVNSSIDWRTQPEDAAKRMNIPASLDIEEAVVASVGKDLLCLRFGAFEESVQLNISNPALGVLRQALCDEGKSSS